MSQNGTTATEQAIQNSSFDATYGLSQVETMGFDGQGFRAQVSDQLALKITTSGSTTYVAKAKPGTDQSEAKWQVKKVDKTSGIVITWADGNPNFDNVASDLTTLTYL